MPTSIKDVARLADVAVPTAYEALRGTGRTSRATRRRVQEAAHKIGYRPNSAARAVAAGRFHSVALILSEARWRTTLPSRMLEGILSHADEHGYHVTLGRVSDDSLMSESRAPHLLQEWSADGLLIDYMQNVPNAMIALVHKHEIPAIWLNCKFPRNCVRPDDLAGGSDVTRRLLAAGHRSITYVDFVAGVEPEPHYSVLDRRAGYEQAMREAGQEPRSITGINPEGPEHQVAFAAEQLRKENRPSAIITYSTREAAAFLLAARDVGLKVPTDLSVATFVRSSEKQSDVFGLSGVIVPEARIGQVAMDALMECIEDPATQLKVRVLPMTRVDGITLGPAPA